MRDGTCYKKDGARNLSAEHTISRWLLDKFGLFDPETPSHISY